MKKLDRTDLVIGVATGIGSLITIGGIAVLLAISGCFNGERINNTTNTSSYDGVYIPSDPLDGSTIVTASSTMTLKPSGSAYVMCNDLVEGITNPDYWLSGNTTIGYSFSTNAYCYNQTYGWQFADKLNAQSHNHFIRFEGYFSGIQAIEVTLTNFNLENYYLENEEVSSYVSKIEARADGDGSTAYLNEQPLVDNIVSASGNTYKVRYNLSASFKATSFKVDVDTFTQALGGVASFNIKQVDLIRG